MKIRSAEFVKSCAGEKDYPGDGRPEIAFAGRSNVGKSSLLNVLLGRKGLAKTSSEPGKTRLITFFLVNSSFYFVDLPGYGYAKVPQAVRESWGPLIEGYVSRQRTELRGVVVLLDVRHPPTVEDRRLKDWLEFSRIPPCYVVTKADKLSRGQRDKALRVIREGLQMDQAVCLVPFSSRTGEGKEDVWEQITRWLRQGTK